MKNDYELLENIDVLFNNMNFIYGAGHDGYAVIKTMMSAGIPIEAVVDKNRRGGICGFNIIDIDQLYDEYIRNNYKINIIIASGKYFLEILQDIESKGIKGNIYSDFGVEKSLEINIKDKRISNNFKEELQIKKELRFRSRYRMVYEGCLSRIMETVPSILIYQAGKVGSNTMSRTLSSYKIDYLSTHCLNPERIMFEDMRHDYCLCNKLLKMKPLKIITMVREPLSRNISSFFEQEIVSDSIGIEEQVINCLNDFSLENWPFSWFKQEFEIFTGINIYQYEFDKDHGYMIIKEGAFNILCLQLEKMMLNENVIGEFLAIPNFHLVEASNVGENKVSGDIYRRVRENLKIPQYIVDRYYRKNNEMDFFYSEEDKSNFLKQIKIC